MEILICMLQSEAGCRNDELLSGICNGKLGDLNNNPGVMRTESDGCHCLISATRYGFNGTQALSKHKAWIQLIDQ